MSKFYKTLGFVLPLVPLSFVAISCSKPSQESDKEKEGQFFGTIKDKEYKIYLNGKPTQIAIEVNQIVHQKNLENWGFHLAIFSTYQLFRIVQIQKDKGKVWVVPLNNNRENVSKKFALGNFKIIIRPYEEIKNAWNRNTSELDLSKLISLQELIDILISQKDANFKITNLKSEKKITNLILDNPNNQQAFINYLNDISKKVDINFIDGAKPKNPPSPVVFHISDQINDLITSIKKISGTKTPKQKEDDQKFNQKTLSQLVTLDVIKELIPLINPTDFFALTKIDHNEFANFKNFVEAIQDFLNDLQNNPIFKSWIKRKNFDLENFEGEFLFQVISGIHR